MILRISLALALLGTALRAGANVTFTDVTTTALPGIASSPGRGRLPPNFTGGAAVADCDGDGRPDIYATGLAHDVLYRNRGDNVFEDVTLLAGLGISNPSRGAAFADIDNDGDLDLITTAGSSGRLYLYVNDGRCSFREEAELRGLMPAERGSITRSVSFGDYDRDGYIDVWVAEFQSDRVNPGVAAPFSRLFHNRGGAKAGYFKDVTERAGVVLDHVEGREQGSFAFTGRFTDLDGDGWPDLAIASGFGGDRLRLR